MVSSHPLLPHPSYVPVSFSAYYSHSRSAYGLLPNLGSKFDFPHIVIHVQHLHIVYLIIPSADDVI
jgi:hypothetical protein